MALLSETDAPYLFWFFVPGGATRLLNDQRLPEQEGAHIKQRLPFSLILASSLIVSEFFVESVMQYKAY